MKNISPLSLGIHDNFEIQRKKSYHSITKINKCNISLQKTIKINLKRYADNKNNS